MKTISHVTKEITHDDDDDAMHDDISRHPQSMTRQRND